jgi:DNA-binding winged helix-turn-helix (wHTH) protein/TolB-like protein
VNRLFQFGAFHLDERERSLKCRSESVPLTPKAFDTLVLLLENPGRLVEKSRLLAEVWNDVHVDDAVVTRAISDLRKVLHRDGETFIQTVPKFGYRFTGEVTVATVTEAPRTPPAPPPRVRPIWRWAASLPLLLATLWLSASRPHAQAPQPLHVAILPLQPLGGSPGDRQLGMGISDALIARLSNLENLIVRPMSSVRRYGDRDADPLQAGRELRVNAVLEGTVESSGGSVRAQVRLIRPEDGKALWSDTVDSSENRLFALQDSLAQQVAAHLAIRLNDEERRELSSRAELNPEAHRLYVQGRYEWGKRTREGIEAAAGSFRQAIDIDPGYAQAYAGLADCYLLLGAYSFQPQLDTLPKAKTMARRALELNPRLAEAHATLALVSQNLDWDWNFVEQQYREAIRLAPNYPTAHHWYAEFLSILGRFKESRREFARAREIDPISPIIQVDEAQLCFFERDYERSLAILRKVLQEDPTFTLAHERMAWVYMMQGREEDAWRESQMLPDCRGEASVCRLTWSAWLAKRDSRAARNALGRLESDARVRHVPLSVLVVGYARQGNPEKALDWFETLAERHEVWLITAKVNPIFEPLSSHPRMRAVLSRLRLV